MHRMHLEISVWRQRTHQSYLWKRKIIAFDLDMYYRQLRWRIRIQNYFSTQYPLIHIVARLVLSTTYLLCELTSFAHDRIATCICIELLIVVSVELCGFSVRCD
jgi:hypothetical protein